MPDSVEAEAAQHYARQAALAVLALQAARKAWRRVDPMRLDSWVALARPLHGTIAAVQYAAAVDAARYIPASLAAQGVSTTALAEVVPGAFAGVASDGRPLATLLDQPRIRVLTRVGEGAAPAEAMAAGLAQLEMIAVTQVQDAGRAAAGAGIVVRPHVAGYVRHLRPPSCSRCAILAGQFYRWNTGFLRHPRCDCRHVPVSSTELYRDEVTSPRAYFDSLPVAEQNLVFTNAGARAIRDGADPAAVVNARRGMYEAGGRSLTRFSTTRRGVVRGQRLMPEQIYADAVDRDDAIRLLERHGYVRVSAPAGGPRVPRPGGRGTTPPASGASGRAAGAGGRGAGGGRPPSPPGGGPVLPGGPRPAEFPGPGEVGGTMPAERRTYEELEVAGRIRPDWSSFSAEERRVAEWLRERGVEVLPVAPELGPAAGSSPDAVVLGARVTLEIKTPTSAGQVQKRLIRARYQAPRAVLDVSRTGMSRAQAVALVGRMLREHGAGYEELLVLGDGFDLRWP